MENKEYSVLVEKYTPKSPKIKDFLYAFFVGGTICTIGQLLFFFYEKIGFSEANTKVAVPITLIICAGLLTGLGIFDKIAKRAGAGTLVPITGFANSVVSPAIEFKTEGFVLGVGANMFKIAGPVIAYGLASSVIYGIIYYIFKTFAG